MNHMDLQVTKNYYIIFSDILTERERQEKLKNTGKFLWTCADESLEYDVTLDRKNSVLGEEVGEVTKEIVDYGISLDKYKSENLNFPPHRRVYFLGRIRKELIEVAACCIAWITALDNQIEYWSKL